MLSKYELNNKIDSYIEKLASSGIVKSFYPNSLNKVLGVPLTPVLERLNRLVDDEILELKFEIRCHERSDTIDIVTDYGQYLGKDVYCSYCNEDVYIDLSNISPIYYIKDEYKEHLKKKEENKFSECNDDRIQGLGNNSISVQEIAIIVMKENNINASDIDFRLSNIEKDIKLIALNPPSNTEATKKSNEGKGVLKSAYGNVKEVRLFSNLLDWIFTNPAGATVTTTALTKLFFPLAMHYYPQYPYIKQYLEIHTRLFDQD